MCSESHERSSPGEVITRVGITEWHGVAHEAAKHPPPGVVYSSVNPLQRSRFWPIRSPIKGFLRRIESLDHDVIEAVISPINTHNRWIYSLAHFAESAAFTFLGAPLPRAARLTYIRRLLAQENCKKIVFWSKAGLETLTSYGGVRNQEILSKAVVVYPAVHGAPQQLNRTRCRDSREVRILFGGDFFRKGGAHVVDAFERAQRQYSAIKLRLCCDEKLDFGTSDFRLRETYLTRIRANPGIELGRVTREQMLEKILPETDIYALPTYVEAFGYAILEAMAFGIPVISTTYFAIPEMIEDRSNGLLIDTRQFDCDRLFKGYTVSAIPGRFHRYMSEEVYDRLCSLIESAELRRRLGCAGMDAVRERFSIDARNVRMSEIYQEAVS